MTGATHAAIGAALGALLKKPSFAFAAGLLSHIIADIVPHKDYSIRTEVILMAASMAAVAVRYGVDSPQFWGALGAIAPDIEHGLSQYGIIPPDREIFPTHLKNGKYHGRVSNERISQLMTVIASVLVAERVY